MSNQDYIPKAHDAFYVWQGNFYDRAQEKLNSFQIDASKFTPVTAAKSKYELAFHRASNPEGANRSDRIERDEREAEYKDRIREFVNAEIRFNARVSDYDKNYLGLTVPDTSHTPVPVPATYPDLTVEPDGVRRIKIHFRDHDKNSTAKPHGVAGAVIRWALLSAPPADVSELTASALDTRTPFEITFAEFQRGQKLYVAAAWQNTRGEMGAFGEIVMAIVP